MRVESISFKNYRNLAELTLEPCEGVNIIYGNNAQGKTNIIEALWLLRLFRSGQTADREHHYRAGEAAY